jgi:putative sigma-54 modulation protein
MNISVSGRHMDLSEATKDYTFEKVDKFDKFFDRITEVKAVLSKESNRYGCELIIALPSHKNIVINKEAENLYAAIDDAANIGERKLRQFKDKMRGRKGHLHDVPDQEQ